MVARTPSRGSARTRRAARRTASSRGMAWLARAGLAARGVLYVLVAVIAIEIAINGSHQQADRTGAVRLVAQNPFGAVMLWLLVIGFGGMTLWKLSEAVCGSPEPGGRKTSKRLTNLGIGVFYAVLTYGILEYALGLGQSASSDNQSQDLTAKALKYPGGQLLVALAGVVIVVVGVCLMYRAYKRTFLKQLRMSSASARTRKIVTRLGQIGGIARGLVYGTIGVFLIIAAKDANPRQAKGIDSALREFAHTPLGPWLLIVVAVGLMMFGVYSWCEARWRAV